MTDVGAPIALAGGFEPANYDTWRRLVEKALAGADFDRKLVARTADGLHINPLYTRADALPLAQAAVPGAAPFTRGTKRNDGRARLADPPARRGTRRRHRQRGDPGGARGRRRGRGAADRGPGPDRHQDRQRERYGCGPRGRLSRLRTRAALGRHRRPRGGATISSARSTCSSPSWARPPPSSTSTPSARSRVSAAQAHRSRPRSAKP